MATELAYTLITPYSLIKSRTGGIIGRALSLSDLELVGANMYAPSDAFIDEYKATFENSSLDPKAREHVLAYLDENCRPENRLGRPNRMMLLLFRGENAVACLKEVVGELSTEPRGDTISGTFGDLVPSQEGGAVYFEPAVLAAPDWETARKQLRLFADRSATDGGVLEDLMSYPQGVTPETTLVMLKPEHFAERSARAGNIIDMFSRTGLYIVGSRLIQMSVKDANEFYGFLRGVFVKKLKGVVVQKLRRMVEESQAFDFRVSEQHLEEMADVLKEANAEREFSSIVEYMTGIAPDQALSDEARARPGASKCLALLYQGKNAIAKIREKLGATNPQLAEGGTVRHDYGDDLLRNGAHASDSAASAERERKIVGLARGTPSPVPQVIRPFLD